MSVAADALKRHRGNKHRAAGELGISIPTLEGRIRRAESIGKSISLLESRYPANDNALKLEVAKREILEKQLADSRAAKRKPLARPRKLAKLTGDTLRVVIPDSHGAHIDKAAAAAFIADLKVINPHSVVMLGDHVDCGGWLAQHHTLGFVAEADVTLEQDVADANMFMDEIQGAAKRASEILYLEGNHEGRLEKWCITQSLRSARDSRFLLSQFAPEVLLRLKDRGVKYFKRSQCYDGLDIQGTIRPGAGKACYVHEGGGTAQQMAKRYGCNIVHGHVHRSYSAVVRTAGAGVIGCWSDGCLSQRQPLWQHGNPTDWVNGYGLEFISPAGYFMHIQVNIVDGISLLRGLKF